MIRLSKNFTLEELTNSATAKRTGIRNEPGLQEVVNLMALVENVLQPLRTWWGREVKIGSGYRSVTVNRLVGGVANSQHVKGQAADLCIDGDLAKGRLWFNHIRDYFEFDQLIWEKNPKTGNYWVHVSYDHIGKNRKQVIDNLIKK